MGARLDHGMRFTFGKNRSKYGAVKTGGLASKLEFSVLELLKLREKAKEIKNIQLQQSVSLTRAKIMYKADFSYEDKETGKTVWVEAKGFAADTWRLKKRLWACYGPGKLEIYTGTYKKPILSETIIPDSGED